MPTPLPQPAADETYEHFIIRAHRELTPVVPDPLQRNELIWQAWAQLRGATPEEQAAARVFPEDRYTRHQNVCIFAEHSAVDGQGEPRTYDLASMVRVARGSNERIADFDGFAPIASGHTPGPDDLQQIQPDILGYAGPFRLGMIGRKSPRWAVFCDEWHQRELAQQLAGKPRRSVELWTFKNDPARMYFDPIAALGAETPRLSLPIKYRQEHRDGQLVERYQFALPGASNTFTRTAMQAKPVAGRVGYEFDEAKHPRDHGQFASTPGAQGVATPPTAAPQGPPAAPTTPAKPPGTPPPADKPGLIQGLVQGNRNDSAERGISQVAGAAIGVKYPVPAALVYTVRELLDQSLRAVRLKSGPATPSKTRAFITGLGQGALLRGGIGAVGALKGAVAGSVAGSVRPNLAIPRTAQVLDAVPRTFANAGGAARLAQASRQRQPQRLSLVANPQAQQLARLRSDLDTNTLSNPHADVLSKIAAGGRKLTGGIGTSFAAEETPATEVPKTSDNPALEATGRTNLTPQVAWESAQPPETPGMSLTHDDLAQLLSAISQSPQFQFLDQLMTQTQAASDPVTAPEPTPAPPPESPSAERYQLRLAREAIAVYTRALAEGQQLTYPVAKAAAAKNLSR